MHRCIQGPEIRGPSRTGVSTQQSFRVGYELATAQADDNGTVTRCWKGGMSSWCKAVDLRKNKWCFPGWVLHEYYTYNSMRWAYRRGSLALPIYVEAHLCFHKMGSFKPVHVFWSWLQPCGNDPWTLWIHRHGQAMFLGLHRYFMEETAASWADPSK